VVVVPDFVANAGAVVAAAHTLVQPRSPFKVEVETVRAEVATRLRSNVAEVLSSALSSGITPHQAAMVLAQQRVRAAMRARGQLT
jgi:glutamate dehydrogenase (NAD(P)+)